MTKLAVGGFACGYCVAAICSAIAPWHLQQFDPIIRVLMPMSGGAKNVAALWEPGMRTAFQFFCGLNGAIYGVIGFVIGIVLQFVRPTVERPLD